MCTADSDFNPEEKAYYLKNKYKEREKQGAFAKIPVPSSKLSSSSSNDTDSSCEAKELRSLLDSTNTKKRQLKRAAKRTSNLKQKIIKKETLFN